MTFTVVYKPTGEPVLDAAARLRRATRFRADPRGMASGAQR